MTITKEYMKTLLSGHDKFVLRKLYNIDSEVTLQLIKRSCDFDTGIRTAEFAAGASVSYLVNLNHTSAVTVQRQIEEGLRRVHNYANSIYANYRRTHVSDVANYADKQRETMCYY